MSDARKKNSTFKKRAHRPWKTDLLEGTVQEAALADDDLFDLDLDLNLDSSLDSDSFFPEFNFTDDMSDPVRDAGKFDLTTQLEMDDHRSEIKQAIQQNQQQHKQIAQQLSDKSGNSILLGGFFQPQQISANNDSPTGRKINSLMSDLKAREQKLSSLNNNLKISEAYERAEQAELSKRAANQQVQAAENRMRQAIEQAKIAEEQFLTAMDQAKQAAMAHNEEARARKEADAQAKDAKVRAHNAEIELQNERMARIAAEEKAQHAFMLAEKASLFQRQLNETSEQLLRLENSKKSEDSRRSEIENKYTSLNDTHTKLQQEHAECTKAIKKLEDELQSVSSRQTNNDQIVADFNSQIAKLKSIIAAEQDLRKSADKKYQEAIVRAERAEQGWQNEQQQRKFIEERAKRAVANASRTVLHMLNTPSDGDFPTNPAAQQPQVTQAKARVKTPAFTATENFDYEEDDLLF